MYDVATNHANNGSNRNGDEHEHECEHNNNHQQCSKYYYQLKYVVNYPSLQCKYKRIVEHKNFLKQAHSTNDVLFYECPTYCDATNTTVTSDDIDIDVDIIVDDGDIGNNKK